MTDLEYDDKMLQIENAFEIAKKSLYKEYALSNAKFKIGDMIKDYRSALVIDRITASGPMFGKPEAVYHGFELKKDLTPRKDKSRVAIFGNKAELLKSAEELQKQLEKTS